MASPRTTGCAASVESARCFGTVYTGDLLFNTALGLYKPRQWSGQDTAIDVIDKLLEPEATSVIYDHEIARNGTSDPTAGS